MERLTHWLKNLGLLFALLFCVELIFGYSGTMIMIQGIAIRHILFMLSAICLYLHCFSYIYTHKIKWFSLKDKTSVFGSFTVMDWTLLVFIISTMVSFLVIPQMNGGSLHLAKSEILDSVAMLLFYYPVRFMIAWDEVSFHKLERILLVCISLLAVIHIILYVGQTFHEGFIEGYFQILSTISGGTAVLPGIVLGHGGYPRVMYSTSIYLLVGIYLLIKVLPHWKFYHYALMGIFVTALLTTMTKSLWYGVFFGIGIFTLCYIIHCLRRKQWRSLCQWFLILAGCVLLSVMLNATLFDGIVEARLNNSFVVSENNYQKDKYESSNKYQDLDNEGAVISNNIKLEQTGLLLEAWGEHPLIGQGYGSYLKDYVRSEKAIFSYEMFLPAMLMKVGIVGVGLLLLLILSAVYVAVRGAASHRIVLFSWFYLLLAIGLCIQTNPILLSFNGISIILFLLWSAFAMRHQKEKERKLHD